MSGDVRDENRVRRPDDDPAVDVAEATAHEDAQLTLAGVYNESDVVTADPADAALAGFRVGYWLGRAHREEGAPWEQ